MLLLNNSPDHQQPLEAADAALLSVDAAHEVERFLKYRSNHRETPLIGLNSLAQELGIASIHVKDEGHRLGLGSFKALGGSYAVIQLALREAAKAMARVFDITELHAPEVRKITEMMTVACATDGNHGRSVAMGAQLVGAKCVIFVHSGVSEERIAAITAYGAEVVRVSGNYDDSVIEATRVANDKGWITVSDTSWPGYEEIPGFVMQGYLALVRETLRALPHPPTHVFVQAGVGGVAAAVAAHLTLVFGGKRPFFTVVEPERAACLMESLKAGHPVKIMHGQPTVMAMLECYEPSLVAWRILSRVADAFMTIDEEEAVTVMRRLAKPVSGDTPIVAGESGGVGLGGLLQVARYPELRSQIGLDQNSRVFVINTEGATDPQLYAKLVGADILLDVVHNFTRSALSDDD